MKNNLLPNPNQKHVRRKDLKLITKMKLSKAQELAEQAIYDYTSSSKWQQVKYMKWTTSEMQDVIAKALIKHNHD